jgi:protein TonB
MDPPPHRRPAETVRYDANPRPRWIVRVAALVSASLHAALLLCFNGAKPPAAVVEERPTLTLNLDFRDLKELEEPEPEPTTELFERTDPGVLVPMQADVPQVPMPTDFIQNVDFASLIEQPDLSQAKVVTIPEHIGRHGPIGQGLGKIFDLSDLDRAPVATLQTAPNVPGFVQREGVVVTVKVEFVVTSEGNVVNTIVRDSTDRRCDEAATIGVSKWKFKPGIKGGRKVNTRMLAPIVFKPSSRGP